MLSKRSWLACAALVAAGCAAFPPLAPAPTEDSGIEMNAARGRNSGSGSGSRARAASQNDLTVFGYGGASAADDEKWAFSLRAIQSRGTIRHAQFLIASSVANVTLFGEVSGATITRNGSGIGQAELVGTLTSGETIRIKVKDRNHSRLADEFSFEVEGGRQFAGKLYHGGVRIMNTRPESAGTRRASGYVFDPQMGLFVTEADLRTEMAPPPGDTDPNILQVVRPDPIIDFREDDLGGFVDAPGADNNRP